VDGPAVRPASAPAVRIITVAVIAGGWEAVARSGLLPGTVLPPFSSVAAGLYALVRQSSTWFDFYVSAWAIGVGLGIGAGAGLLTAALIGASARVWRVFEPLLYYVGSMPKIIILPVLLLYLSTGIYSKVGMAAVSAFFPVAITTAQAMREVREVHLRAARCLGAGRWRLLAKVYAPAAIGPVLSGLRLGLAVAVTGVLLAETSVASAGLGYQAMQYYDNLAVADMYALLLLVLLAAVAANSLLGWLIRHVTRYHQPTPEKVFFT
jgi:ABC-type nitrate/sulfonate/bicarbonate transport system permease component